MKKKWKKLMAAWCAVVMLMTMPGVGVLADEMRGEDKLIVEEAVAPEEPVESVDAPIEGVTESVDVPVNEDASSPEAAEEVVGKGPIQVGKGVTATFDTNTGAVEFNSQDGELWSNWVEKLGVERDDITSIKVASGTVYLPAWSAGYEDVKSEIGWEEYYMFGGLKNLTSLDLSSFDTSNVTSMSGMFYECHSLTNLDLSGFDTSNVTDMSGMFYNCICLKNLDLSSFDTSNVTDMYGMFYSCYWLTNLDLSDFDTSNVTDMSRMFNGCHSLTNLDLNSFDTSNVTDMSRMISGCSSLTNLDLSSFDTSNVTDMSWMISGCSSLTNLDLNSFDTSNVTDMSRMFSGCSSLTNLDLSSFDMSNLDNYKFFIEGCDELSILKTPKKNNKPVDLSSRMIDESNNEYIVLPAISQSITLRKMAVYENVPVGENVTATFDETKGTVEFYSEDGTLWKDWIKQAGFVSRHIQSIRVASGTVYLPEDSSSIFTIPKLSEIDVSGIDTSNVTDMSHMFSGCSLTNLDLSSFNTSNVTNMECMFSGCSRLTNLDLSSFNTSNVTNMERMFSRCSRLTNLDLSDFDTSNVTDMMEMFYLCEDLTDLDLSSFNTPKVTTMSSMFNSCDSLTKLDLSSFNASNVEDMGEMFAYCNSLRNLNLSGFDTSKVTCHGHMLDYCNSLITLNTPKKNSLPIQLPLPMCDESGKEYNSFPTLSKSITLTKKKVDIADCKISLAATSYTYDGKAKKPSVTVRYEEVVLVSGTDYTVSYKNNTNAGTATVVVNGIGDEHKGSKSVTFTIKKANAKLIFAKSAITKKTTDAAFTNTLTKTTDGTVTFKSSNTKVAAVNSTSGRVTIKGVGKATITATASAGKNYAAGSAKYTLTVKAPSAVGFSDVQDPSHPFYKAIYWAADAGITKGYSDGTFGIDKPCTRGEAVMFLWRMAGQPAPAESMKSPFSDVPKTHAFFKAVLWASQRGIAKGYSDGTFGINGTCTRGHIMMFIWRFKGQPAPKAAAQSPFSDVPKTHAFYKAILWGSQTGVTNGFSDGTFGIDKNCTRGQIVTFLYRIK